MLGLGWAVGETLLQAELLPLEDDRLVGSQGVLGLTKNVLTADKHKTQNVG